MIIIGMGDGSVRGVYLNIKLQVWKDIATRNGGEKVGDF